MQLAKRVYVALGIPIIGLSLALPGWTEHQTVIITRPGVVSDVVQPPEVTETRRTTIIPLTAPATTTTTEWTSLKMGPFPSFKTRISRMKEWVEEGAAKGFLTAAQAEQFRSDVAALEGFDATVAKTPMDRAKTDQMERLLNSLNIRMADAMKGFSIAGSGQLR
ncbi:MAG TPA: hypothetical protein V6D17_13100 [Candidatus Obscuribacterales bacterium]